MTETKRACKFETNAENEIYMSLIEPAWQSTVLNKALSHYMREEALIDIADGKGVVSFWKKLDFHKKAEVLQRFGSEGTADEKADAEIWDVVLVGEPKDFFVMAAKYLTIHQLKYGKPWAAAKEITGEYTRELRRQRREKYSKSSSASH